jgi:hypothetical protein
MEAVRGALRGMKNSRNHFEFLLLVCALIFAAVPNGIAQPVGVGGANDFTSVEYFDAPHAQQIRSRVSGAQGLPQPGGRFVIKQFKLEMFTEDGKPEWIVTAPECVYDSINYTANSAGPLQLQSGDGKVRVDGDGFLWRQNDYFLTISNNVQTVIENSMMSPMPNGHAGK